MSEHTETDGDLMMRLYWTERLERLRTGQEDAPPIPLREWFAGQALAGIMAHPRTPATVKPDDLADDVYLIADAILKARKNGADHETD